MSHLSSPETNRESFSEEENTEITKDLPMLLIVEDNLDVTRYLKSLLVTNYNVYTAMNGREGLDKALGFIPGYCYQRCNDAGDGWIYTVRKIENG